MTNQAKKHKTKRLRYCKNDIEDARAHTHGWEK